MRPAFQFLDGFDESASHDDIEHYRVRFQGTLDRLISLDDAIHDFYPTMRTRKI